MTNMILKTLTLLCIFVYYFVLFNKQSKEFQECLNTLKKCKDPFNVETKNLKPETSQILVDFLKSKLADIGVTCNDTKCYHGNASYTPNPGALLKLYKTLLKDDANAKEDFIKFCGEKNIPNVFDFEDFISYVKNLTTLECCRNAMTFLLAVLCHLITIKLGAIFTIIPIGYLMKTFYNDPYDVDFLAGLLMMVLIFVMMVRTIMLN